MVTVVDEYNFLLDYKDADDLDERGLALDKTDQRNIVDLLIDQVEFADVILVNKRDLVADKELSTLTSIIRKINPYAAIKYCDYGRIDPGAILGTGSFNYEKASQNPGWMQEIRGSHTPETEEFGISSFVYRAREPFHPSKLMKFIESAWDLGIIRAKGFIWLASRTDESCLLSLASRSCQLNPTGYWIAANPAEKQDLSPEDLAEVEAVWHPTLGDRMQEIVFIGVDVDQEKITSQLNECLLETPKQVVFPPEWKALQDPFPIWH